MLKLSVRRLEPFNLCQSQQDEDSCRVTVSDKDFGSVYALVQLRGDDDVGPRSVGQRSLVRIVGTLGQDVSPTDGAPSSTRPSPATGPSTSTRPARAPATRGGDR